MTYSAYLCLKTKVVRNISSSLNLSSVELQPTAQGAAWFSVDSSKVFKEDTEITPVTLSNKSQISWGKDWV